MFEPTGTPPVCVEVVITATSAEWLAAFARSLVDDHVVARGQVTAATRAIFHRPDGRIQDGPRARLALHTRAALVPEIVDRAGRQYPDGVPDVVALEFMDGDADYLQWIMHETAAAHRVRVPAGRFAR